jgi:hypothetical protein
MEFLNNKYVLYGGVALAALGAFYFFMPSATPAEDNAASNGYLPTGLIPAGAGGGYAMPDAGASANGLDGGWMTSLINLENKKVDSNEKVSLADIDATYKTTMAVTAANLQLGVLQTDAMNVQSFASIYENASKLLSVDTITAVTGNINYGGKPLTFDFARFQSGYPTHNQNTLNAISGYYEANRGTPNTSPPAVSGAGQLRITGAPSAANPGRASAYAAATPTSVGRAQPASNRASTFLPLAPKNERTANRR